MGEYKNKVYKIQNFMMSSIVWKINLGTAAQLEIVKQMSRQ